MNVRGRLMSLKSPRVGHPAKEGLRRLRSSLCRILPESPRVGHPAKEGLRLRPLPFLYLLVNPEWVIQQKRD